MKSSSTINLGCLSIIYGVCFDIHPEIYMKKSPKEEPVQGNCFVSVSILSTPSTHPSLSRMVPHRAVCFQHEWSVIKTPHPPGKVVVGLTYGETEFVTSVTK